jgi:3-isopropylmalate/(R)-2-methylmalate dehydratase small subunit
VRWRAETDSVQPFTRLTAVAVPMDLPNVDSDRIIPARFLRKPKSAGYGAFLFHDLRFDGEQREQPEFVLNRPEYRRAQILVGAEGFGCGAPQEMAVWALSDWGFRCIIAPSFGDIFFDHCATYGVLAVMLSAVTCAGLRRQLHEGPGGTMTVDLEDQSVAAANGTLHRFTIDALRKQAMLAGRGDRAPVLGYEKEIALQTRRANEPAVRPA